MPFDAIVFDFDETLVNLEPQHILASQLLSRERGDDYDSLPEEMRTRSGTRVLDDVREMRDSFGWTESVETLHARRRVLFDQACLTDDISVMPGAIEAVENAARLGFSLAIASSGDHPSIELILERLGIRRHFRAVVGGEDVRAGKPDPESYLRAAELLATPPSRCIAVEDSSVGVRAAKAAEMFCIAIRNPQARTRQDLSLADLELASIRDLPLEALRVRL
ncbi:MAG TPA: HAD family phosphatase [Thermoanaerobaculia bacterium]|nr:HAD family phosphatase [Thermoanaerobaculia bacterium]